MNHQGQTYYDNHHHESKARANRHSNLPGDGDFQAPNNITENMEKKEKHQLNHGGPSNRQEAPVPT